MSVQNCLFFFFLNTLCPCKIVFFSIFFFFFVTSLQFCYPFKIRIPKQRNIKQRPFKLRIPKLYNSINNSCTLHYTKLYKSIFSITNPKQKMHKRYIQDPKNAKIIKKGPKVQIRLWVVEFLSKFQPDPTDGSKVTPLFLKRAQAHIASKTIENIKILQFMQHIQILPFVIKKRKQSRIRKSKIKWQSNLNLTVLKCRHLQAKALVLIFNDFPQI